MSPSTIQHSLLITNLAATAVMVGVIWVIQLIVYPGFLLVETVDFPQFHQRYSHHITWIVGPPMLLEIGSALLLLPLGWQGRFRGLLVLNALTVLIIWAITGLVQVPQHRELAAGYSAEIIGNLVEHNWPRTALWTLRLGLVIPLLLLLHQPRSGD